MSYKSTKHNTNETPLLKADFAFYVGSGLSADRNQRRFQSLHKSPYSQTYTALGNIRIVPLHLQFLYNIH